MADNVAITAGTGTDIATDDISSAHYQLVKLTLGELNSNDGPVSTTNPIPAKIRGTMVTVAATVTRPSANGTQYNIGDALSDSATVPTAGGGTITGAARASGGSGVITDIVATTTAAEATPPEIELWIFDTAPTAINDNAAFTVSDSEAQTLVARVPFTFETIGANGHASANNLGIGFTTVGSANLRFLVRVTNTYTPLNATPGETFTFRLKILQVD